MPILEVPATPAAPHQNPPLREGEVYRIIQGYPDKKSPAGDGGIFVCGYNEVVYLTRGGGYDLRSRVVADKFKFELCTLQVV